MNNFQKNKRVDVFKSYLVKTATYSGNDEFPNIEGCNEIPNKIIPFSSSTQEKDHTAWISFYEHDYKFECIWHNPKQYLSLLKRFQGVISPDFSMYADMPLCMQKWSKYRGHALANWWIENDIKVIPNVRFSDERSYSFCFDGIRPNSTVAIGSVGAIREKENRSLFAKGIYELVCRLTPTDILVYGPTPRYIFDEYITSGIKIHRYPAKNEYLHKEVTH